MRKRCFIVGTILLLISGFFWLKSNGSEKLMRKRMNEVERLNALSRFVGERPRTRAEAGATSRRRMETARTNATIAGFLALGAFAAGFIIGPPKKNYLVPLDEES